MCGIPNSIVFHIWNIFIVADSIGHFVLFNTEILGDETPNKGVLSSYSIILMSIGIGAIYGYSFFAEDQRSEAIRHTYRLNMITLVVASVCYLFDAYLFNFEKKTFCNWQLYDRTTCD